MSACIYCIDNDIIKKLATFQLFDKTIQLFDASYEQVNILETAKYKFENDWKKFEGGLSRKTEDPVINYKQVRKDSGLKTCSSNACLARVLGQNKGFCLSWLIVNKQRKMTVFGSLLRIEIDLVSSSISKVFAQQGVQ